MSKTLWGIVAAVVLLAVVFGGWHLWLGWHDANVRATAALEARRDYLGRERDLLASTEAARKAAEVEHARVRAQLELANRATAERERLLQATSGRLDSALRAQLAPSQQVQLDSLVGAYEGRLAGLDSVAQRNALAAHIAITDLASCNRAAEALRGQAEAYRQQAEAWRARAQPGFLARLLAGLPFLAVGAVGGAATAAVAVAVLGHH